VASFLAQQRLPIADCQLPIADLKSTNLTIWQSAIRNTMKVLGEIHHEN
jgi:hypothetical protein